MTPKEKLMAEIDELLVKAFPSQEAEVKADEVVVEEKVEKSLDEVSDAKAKGTDIDIQANGGGDVIKNKDQKDAGIEKVSKKKDSDEDEDGDEDEDDKKKKGKDMKKSFEVSQEDFELLQKSKADAEAKAKLEEQQNDPLFKSISGLTDLIKSQSETIGKLSADIETLKKTPAREPKSLNGYTKIEKGGEAAKEAPRLMKSQVLDTLWELQKSGKVQDVHVCEYEGTGNIQDSSIKQILQAELDKKYKS